MIIRSGLIRNRDGVDFAAFSERWRRVHGPLALRVEAMRAYRQNHFLARLPAREGDRLHRVDGISQLWFDNVEVHARGHGVSRTACLHRGRSGVSQRRDNPDSAGGRKAAAR